MQAAVFVGIDIAKAQLDVALRPSGKSWEVRHDEAGMEQVVEQLRASRVTLVVVEATGGLEGPLSQQAQSTEGTASRLDALITTQRLNQEDTIPIPGRCRVLSEFLRSRITRQKLISACLTQPRKMGFVLSG